MKPRKFDAQEERVGGPIQFGDDWPGIFLRGDNAAYLAFLLRSVINQDGGPLHPITKVALEGYIEALAGCIVRPTTAESSHASPDPASTSGSTAAAPPAPDPGPSSPPTT